jgi:hypothetical protein
MYTLNADEKTSLVMIYTAALLVRGEVVTKQGIRVSTWLRTDGAPEYMHLINVQVLNFLGSQVRSSSFPEMFMPAAQVIGFHLVPPAQDTLDYEADEANRTMQPVTVLLGSFLIAGKVRISTQTGFATSIATSRLAWMSIYEASISSPALPQMAALAVPMLVVRPNHVSFAMTVDKESNPEN